MANDLITVAEARKGMASFLAAPERAQHLGDLLNGRGIDVRTFAAAVVSDTLKQPKLALAIRQAPETLMEQLSVCATSGLLPGSAYGQFYLIPRRSQKAQRTEVTSIVGYKGLCDMAQRHDRVHRIEALVVVEGEEFDWDPGAGKLHHRWNPNATRDSFDAVVAAYARVVLTTPNGQQLDPTPLYHVMSRGEIEAARARSDGYKSAIKYNNTNTPWITDPMAMVRKTPIRRILGGGSVPRQFALIHLMGHESHEEHRIEEEEVKVSEAGKRATMGDVLGISDAPGGGVEIDMEDARRRLHEQTKDDPEYLDPSMLSDEEVLDRLKPTDD